MAEVGSTGVSHMCYNSTVGVKSQMRYYRFLLWLFLDFSSMAFSKTLRSKVMA